MKRLSVALVTGLTALAESIISDPKGYNQNKFSNADGTIGCLALRYSRIASSARAHAERVNESRSSPLFATDPLRAFAVKKLKLTDEQDSKLFSCACCGHWPTKFAQQYNSAKTDKGRARAAYNRIVYFIKTNGTDRPATATA